ncbi:MAG: hypothetical protein KDK50_01985 [Chlamydiia bacterium]|nr:hypothetical protein [Chlamydiia bacterium]MCP5491476.1 hypothetical protein [Chlamydiales bacterium]
MDDFSFSGLTQTKLDDKNRFVLPQAMRYGLVEKGELKFALALGLGGCLVIYRMSDIAAIIAKFKAKQHVARFQKFFTLFFSTLHYTTCDKLGRVVLPGSLKQAAGITGDIAIAGVLDKIEIWPQERYDAELASFMTGAESGDLKGMIEEAFSLLGEEPKSTDPVEKLESLV